MPDLTPPSAPTRTTRPAPHLRRRAAPGFGLVLSAVALLLALVAGACSSTPSTTTTGSGDSNGSSNTEIPDDSGDTGGKKVFKEDQTEIRIGAGEKFAIRLPQNPSIGDNWKLVSEPDDSFVKYDGESFKADPSDAERVGAGGQQEFKFKAKKDGTTTVTMFNCYRCSNGTVAPENSQYAERITFTITVG